MSYVRETSVQYERCQNSFSIAILGLGPRGLGILERIVANQAEAPPTTGIEIHVVDTQEYGTGVHQQNQPEHLLINTIASQVTMFSDESVRDAGPILPGPSLSEWAQVDANKYVSRATLGRYLRFVYQVIVGSLPPHIRLIMHNSSGEGVTHDPETNQYRVTLADGQHLDKIDYLFITTGHAVNRSTEHENKLASFTEEAKKNKNPLVSYFRCCYPLSSLDTISKEAVVAIQGTGLSAHDVVSALTVGHGGRFSRDENGKLVYHASNQEPRQYLFSRTSLPFASRARNEKGVGGQHKARFFTLNAIDVLRSEHSQLDFEQHLLPLLVQEMAFVMRTATNGGQEPSVQDFKVSEEELLLIHDVFYPVQGQSFANLNEYNAFTRKWMENDLMHAKLGNCTSPVKSATDVLRDVRDLMRNAIEQRGLTPTSHQHFLEHYMPILNRIAVGPPACRDEEWLVLMEANILSFGGGPNAQLVCNEDKGTFGIRTTFGSCIEEVTADVLICAKMDSALPQLDSSPLFSQLLSTGIVRPHLNGDYHPGGIDVTRDAHPISANGDVLSTCWTLGTPTEGANFYTYILPRPLVNSRFIADAGRSVLQMFNDIQARTRTKAFESQISKYERQFTTCSLEQLFGDTTGEPQSPMFAATA